MQVFAWHQNVHHYTTKQNTDSPQNGNILEILSADSRRNSELPQLGCVHFPRWQEETSRFERPRSSGSTHDENSVVLRYLLHSFANVLQCFLDLLLLVSWFWFWENCLSWWSFPNITFSLAGRFADPPRKVWPWRGRTHRDQVVVFWIQMSQWSQWVRCLSVGCHRCHLFFLNLMVHSPCVSLHNICIRTVYTYTVIHVYVYIYRHDFLRIPWLYKNGWPVRLQAILAPFFRHIILLKITCQSCRLIIVEWRKFTERNCDEF